MSQLFNPEKQPWKALALAVDFAGLSLCCAFCCLGVVTLGPSLTALYVAVVKTFRHGDNTPFRLFFGTFVKNLKQGIEVTLVVIPALLLIAFGYTVMKANSGSPFGAVIFYMYYAALLVPVGVILNLFPLMGRFSLSFKELFKTAFQLAIGHLPATFVIVLLSLELMLWTINYRYPVFAAPSLWALLSSFFLERNYEKHLTDKEIAELRGISLEEYLEDKEKREEFPGKFKYKKR